MSKVHSAPILEDLGTLEKAVKITKITIFSGIPMILKNEVLQTVGVCKQKLETRGVGLYCETTNHFLFNMSQIFSTE